MARSVTDASLGWGVNGLITSVNGEIDMMAETVVGLPSEIRIVGQNKMWKGDFSGYVTPETTITLAHDDKVACNVEADGIKVKGYLTSFSLKGASNSLVEFSASAEGAAGEEITPAVPGDPIFLESCTIETAETSQDILEFSLDCSWNLAHVYNTDPEAGDIGDLLYSSIAFKKFEGSLTFVTSEASSGKSDLTTGDTEATFSVTCGGVTIVANGKITNIKQMIKVDDVVRYQKTMIISSFGSEEGGT